MGFDFAAAFGRPVKLVNDAAMQALGGYRDGRMPTYEDYVGAHALERMGRKKWRKHAIDVIEHTRAAMVPNDVLIGGGNARYLEALPEGCRLGDNADAFTGGFRLWQRAACSAATEKRS